MSKETLGQSSRDFKRDSGAEVCGAACGALFRFVHENESLGHQMTRARMDGDFWWRHQR
jgi:hypothetical protein